MPNPDHIFEIFGKFSHENTNVVWASIVDYITCNLESFKECMVVVLTMLHLNLDECESKIQNSLLMKELSMVCVSYIQGMH